MTPTEIKWISVNDKLPKGLGAIVNVKRENGQELKAYYHEDSACWLNFYGIKTSKFENYERDCEFLFDITHWRSLEK